MLDDLVLNLKAMLTQTVCSHLLYLSGFIVYIWFKGSEEKYNRDSYWALCFGGIIGSLSTALMYNPGAFYLYWVLICITFIFICIMDNK